MVQLWLGEVPGPVTAESSAKPVQHLTAEASRILFSMTQHHMFPVVHPLDLHAGIYMSVWAFGDIFWTEDWPIGQFWRVWSWQHWNKPTIQYQVDLSYSAFTVAVSTNKLFCALEKSTHWGFGPQDTKTTWEITPATQRLACKLDRKSRGGVEVWARVRGQGRATLPGVRYEVYEVNVQLINTLDNGTHVHRKPVLQPEIIFETYLDPMRWYFKGLYTEKTFPC